MHDPVAPHLATLWHRFSSPERAELFISAHAADGTLHCPLCRVVWPCRLVVLGQAAVNTAVMWERRFA